jgi:hypothetical protein
MDNNYQLKRRPSATDSNTGIKSSRRASNANNNNGSEADSKGSHLDPVQYVAVMAENDELKAELEIYSKQLENANKKTEDSHKEVFYSILRFYSLIRFLSF